MTLTGVAFADEAEALIQRVLGVPGVRSIENRLELEPAAPGAARIDGRPGEWLRNEWSPTTRLIAGTAGAGLAAAGMSRGGVRGLLLAVTGLALIARALADREVARVLGGREHRPDGSPAAKTIDAGQGLAW